MIAGPTASGKSALALELAQRTGGVLVNADSAQIYRDLPILSAAPSPRERASAEHRLYGTLDGALACSAADWAVMAKQEIADIHESDRPPIIVGGTGLYLRTLLDGIAPVPEIDSAVRSEVRASTASVNYRRLADLDPAAARRLNHNDTTRIARALEVVLSSGRPLSEWQSERTGGIADELSLRALILLPPRDWLYRRCDERFSEMIEGGAVEEVGRLLARGLDPDLPVMRAIGVPELSALIAGDWTKEEAIAAGRQSTRRYAKRQYTWFSRQPPVEWPRFMQPLDPATIDEALALIGVSRSDR